MKAKILSAILGVVALAGGYAYTQKPQLLGAMELWKFTSSLLQPVVSTWNVYAPANLRFDGEIQPDGATCSNGEILKKTGANDWDCAADATGSGGSATIQVREPGGSSISPISTMSFDPGAFNIAASAGSATDAVVRLDYTNGPASRSKAETISALWAFNSGASISSNLEVEGTASISGKLTLNGPASASGNFEANPGAHFISANAYYYQANDTAGTATNLIGINETNDAHILPDLVTLVDSAFIGYNSPIPLQIGGSCCGGNPITSFTIDTSGAINFTVDNTIRWAIAGSTPYNLDGQNNLIVNIGAAGTDFTTGGGLTLASKLQVNAVASVSSHLEIGGYASASLFTGSAFGGIDCNDVTDQLLWSAGVFTCETLGASDIPDLSAVYLPLAGGTMAGNINMNGNAVTNASDLTLAEGGVIQWNTNTRTITGDNSNDIVYDVPGVHDFEVSNTDVFNLSSSLATLSIKLQGTVASLSSNLEVGEYASVGGTVYGRRGSNSSTIPAFVAGADVSAVEYAFSFAGGRAMQGFSNATDDMIFNAGSQKGILFKVNGTNNTFNSGTTVLTLPKDVSGASISQNLEVTGYTKTAGLFVSSGASFSAGVTGTLDTLVRFGATSAVPPSTSFATFDTRNDFTVLDFGDITAATQASKSIFIAVMPTDYDDGTLSVKLHYSATSATSGDVVWDVQFERVGDGQLDIDAGGWATAQTATCTVPGTTGFVDVCTLTFTQAQADGILKGELFRMRVIRDTTDANDTVTTDIELHAVEVTQ